MGAVQQSSTMSSKLLTNGTILAFDSNTSSISVLRNAHLLITGDTITTISSDLSSIEKPTDTETIDCTDKIVSPGFVDTHRHVWQAAWRTLGPNTTLAEYLLKKLSTQESPPFSTTLTTTGTRTS
jgi:cytosine/adenosine deaminase-related metal-dependent hydrolase